MVLLNFLLAIIVDAFSVVKDNTSESTGLHEEIGQMMREKWRAMLGRMLNVHYIPSSRLSALLKHWAGNDSDGPKTAVAEVEDQSKRIKVLDHELEEHALKEVLSEAMQNMLATAPELSPDERAGGGCMGRKGKSRSANLSTQELDSATKWLLERFGHEGGDDKEDSDADDDEVRCRISLMPRCTLRVGLHTVRDPEQPQCCTATSHQGVEVVADHTRAVKEMSGQASATRATCKLETSTDTDSQSIRREPSTARRRSRRSVTRSPKRWSAWQRCRRSLQWASTSSCLARRRLQTSRTSWCSSWNRRSRRGTQPCRMIVWTPPTSRRETLQI